jgi:hypothetical protein
MLRNKSILNKLAVGYCKSEHIPFVPKKDHKAVMFFKDDEHFWCHMTNDEFNGIFK